MKNLVFTYGTLMRGQIGFGKFGNMEFFADGVLSDYGLYEAHGFPAAVPVKGFSVFGEIYEVDDITLNNMDKYEREGELYIRRLVEVAVGPMVFDVWFYEYNGDVSNLELRAPIGKWNTEKKPISNYAWYVCYGSNLLKERFDYYLKKTNAIVHAEKPYMLNGEVYFAKKSGKWDNKGICFLDLNKSSSCSYGWAYLVDEKKINAISEEEGALWYPVQEIGKDEFGIKAFTVTNIHRFTDNMPGIDYLTIIAAGLNRRFGLSKNEIRRYLGSNEIFYLDESNIQDILNRHC